MPRPHPPEFRQRAVELARLREKPVAQIAADLGISDQLSARLDGPRRHRRRPAARLDDRRARRAREAPPREAGARVGGRDPEAGLGLLRQGEHPPKRLIYAFIAEHCSDLPIGECCRVMKASRSAYFAWRANQVNPTARMIDDAELGELVVKVHDQSFGTYGWRRVTAELRLGLGREVNHKRVQRLMRERGLSGVTRRRRTKGCTRSRLDRSTLGRSGAPPVPP